MRRRARQMLPTHQCHFAAPRLRRAATPAASSQLSISILSNKTNQRNNDYCHAALLCAGAMHRHRGDSNPCGQSPMDFESISLAALTQCLRHRSPAMLPRAPGRHTRVRKLHACALRYELARCSAHCYQLAGSDAGCVCFCVCSLHAPCREVHQ